MAVCGKIVAEALEELFASTMSFPRCQLGVYIERDEQELVVQCPVSILEIDSNPLQLEQTA